MMGLHCRLPDSNLQFRTDRVGLVPIALAEFGELRKQFKQKKAEAIQAGDKEAAEAADRKQTVYKILSNSLYGVIGCPWSRFYDVEIARGVTSTARWLIKQVIEFAKPNGIEVIYADTDSVYAIGCSHADFAKFVKKINVELFPPILKELGCINNYIELAYQESFSILVFPQNEDGPVAKRFFGKFSHYDGKPVEKHLVEIKGIEIKRGDTAKLARTMQQEVVDLLMNGEENPQAFEDLIERWRHKIMEDEMDLEDIVISKSVKSLDSYKTKGSDGNTRVLPAQARIAKELIDRGESIVGGDRVGYVVLDSLTSPMTLIPAEDYDGKTFDRFYIWQRTYDPTLRVLWGALGNKRNWLRWKFKKLSPRNKPLSGQMRLL